MNLGNETEQREFKKSTSELREGIESIASILNKHESGELFFGVRADGEVIGQDVSESTLRQISQAVGNKIRPVIYPTIEALVDDDDGHSYIRVAFQGSDRPYSCDGRYRIRVSDEDVLMSGDELGRMYVERAASRWPWDEWPSGLEVDAIDRGEFESFLARGRARGRIASEFNDISEALESFDLLESEKLTNAAAVLFVPSRDVRLKLAVFATHARTEILDLRQEQGTVFSLVNAGERYVLENTRRRLVIEGGGPRDEVPEIPRQAVREALINAFAHMDWTLGGAVLVEIYYDAIEIDSPGWFIEGQDPKEHLSGLSRSSRTRNRLIAHTLYRSGDIESEGSGIPRIKELCDAAGIRIEYLHTPDGARLVFHRNDAFGMEGDASPLSDIVNDTVNEPVNDVVNDTVNEPVSEPVNEPGARTDALNRRQGEILGLIADNSNITLDALAQNLKVSRSTVKREIEKLKAFGILRRTGSDKNGSWQICTTGEPGTLENDGSSGDGERYW